MNKELTINEIKRIASLKNKKYRDLHGLYIIEGEHLISELIKSGKKGLKYVVMRHDYDNPGLTDNLPDKYQYRIKRIQFNKLIDTKSPQGILAVVQILKEEKPIDSKIIVALDTINDPGNLGTILRTCYWYGIDTVIIGNNSADVYNPKTIRASQGAIFHVNFKTDANLEFELNELLNKDYNIYLTSLSGQPITDKTISNGKSIIVFGNEENGISSNLLANKEYKQIKIKSYTDCESLNVSVSAGIIINEFKKLFEKQ